MGTKRWIMPLLMVSIGVLLVAMAKARAADGINAAAIQQKIANRYDERIRRGLDSFLKNDVYLLNIKITLKADKVARTERSVEKAKADADLALLPDLPINFEEKDYGKLVGDTLSDGELEAFVEKAEVRLVIDESIPSVTTQLVSRTIKDIVDPNGVRSDSIAVERAALKPEIVSAEISPRGLNPFKWTGAEWSVFVRHNQNLLAMGFLGVCLMAGLCLLGMIVGRQINRAAALRAAAPVVNAPEVARNVEMPAPTVTSALPPPPPVQTQGPGDSAMNRMIVGQVATISRERPQNVAAVLRTYLSRKEDAAKAVACIRLLPLDASKQVVNQLSARESALLRSEMQDPTAALAADDAAAAFRQFHTAVLAQELSRSAADWEFLGALSDRDLLQLASEEGADTQALILFYLPSQRATKIYESLPEENRAQVISTIFELENRDYAEIQPAVVELRERAKALSSRPEAAVADPVAWVTSVGPRLSEQDRSRMVAGVESALSALSGSARAAIRAKLFSFVDAVILPEEILGAVLQAFRPNELGTLVASLDEGSELYERILQVLPTQMREIVGEEAQAQRALTTKPHTRRRFVSESLALRNRFEQFVKTMDARGEISLAECFEAQQERPDESQDGIAQTTDELSIEPQADAQDDDYSQAA